MEDMVWDLGGGGACYGYRGFVGRYWGVREE